MVCFLNKIDAVEDEELVELVEMELRELLSFYKCAFTPSPPESGVAVGREGTLHVPEVLDSQSCLLRDLWEGQAGRRGCSKAPPKAAEGRFPCLLT